MGVAKHLSMIEKNEHGKLAREYFIEVENRFLALQGCPPKMTFDTMRKIIDEVEAHDGSLDRGNFEIFEHKP